MRTALTHITSPVQIFVSVTMTDVRILLHRQWHKDLINVVLLFFCSSATTDLQ